MKALLLGLLLTSPLLAANYGTLTGTVTDKSSGKPVSNASVAITDADFGAATDSAGNFTIPGIPEAAYEVVISAIGYNTQKIAGIEIKANLTTRLKGELIPLTIEVKENTITYKKPAVQLDQTSSSTKLRRQAEAWDQGDALSLSAPMPMIMEESMQMSTGGYSAEYEGQFHVRGSRIFGGANIMPPRPDEPPPTDWNTEGYNRIYENEFLDVTKNPLSTFSIDVDQASYANMRRFLGNSQLPPPDAVRIEEFINYFDYDYPEPEGEHPFSITTELGECPWTKDHQLLHVGLQGKRVKTDKLPPSSLTFLIDVSGSMQPANKLPLLKSAFRMMVEQLRPEDRVAIVVYASQEGLVLPSTKGDRKQDILAALDMLGAGGSTAGGAGMILAYKTAKENFLKKGNNRVIWATDGDFNTGVTPVEMQRMMEENRKEGIFLTMLGFGEGNLQDSRMEQLADKGNGQYFYIDGIVEAKRVMVEQIGGTLLTIAKDVKIQIEFNPAKVAAYRLIGYENRLLKAEDFHDDTKDAGEIGAGHSVTAIYELVPFGVEMNLPKVDDLKYQSSGVDPKAFKTDEILTLKLRYKDPDKDVSKLLEQPLKGDPVNFDKSSDNFRFSAAVASFGMLLRDSKFKGTSDFAAVSKWAKGAKGRDSGEYRAEFIRLVETASLLKQPPRDDQPIIIDE